MKIRKVLLPAMVVLALFGLTACSGIEYTIPENPIEFEQGSYVNPDDTTDMYDTISYNGKTYAPYGALANVLSQEEVDTVLGYVVDITNPTDESVLVVTLSKDYDHNFLMLVEDNGTGEITFYRDLATADEDIEVYGYIEPLAYPIWNN